MEQVSGGTHYKPLKKCTEMYMSILFIDNDWDKNVLCEQDINFDIHDMKISHIIRLGS